MKSLTETILVGLMLIGLAIALGRLFAGCFPADKEVAAASGYEAQQLRCVDQYADRASIDKCRNRVKAAWATDAGKDGAP